MKIFEFKDTKVFFNDFNQQQRLVLDYSPLINHSSMPSYLVNQKGYRTNNFLDWLSAIFTRVSQWKDNGAIASNGLVYLITSLLTVQQLVRKQRDFHVLEIGCDPGALSVLIAEILKHFNSNNRLICVSEEQVNTEQDIWLQLMSTSSAADIVSRYIGDFTDLPFRENYFDIVIINGNTQFAQVEKVFQQAALVLRNQGTLYGISEQRPDVDVAWSKMLGAADCYPVDEETVVYAKQLSAKNRQVLMAQTTQNKFSKIKETVNDNLTIIKNSVFNLNNLTKNELDKTIGVVSQTEDQILKIFNQLISLNLKFYLNELKEALINYRLELGEKTVLEKVCRQRYQQLVWEIENSEDF
jgi:ubiquinone/menaquinone biosynthesis C-methylase UbiE